LEKAFRQPSNTYLLPSETKIAVAATMNSLIKHGYVVWGLILMLCVLDLASSAPPPTNAPVAPTSPAPSVYIRICDQVDSKIVLISAIALIVVGLGFLFYGHKIYKPVIFVFGLLIGFAVAFIVLQGHTSLKMLWLLIISGAIGLIFGVIFIVLIKIGIFFMGFGVGIVVCGLVLATPIGTQVIHCCAGGSWYPLIAMGISGLAVGILALIFQKIIIILATSIGGAYSIAFAIDCAWVKSNFSEVIPAIISLQKLHIDSSNMAPYLLIAGVLLLSVAGFFVQLCYTSKHSRHEKEMDSVINN